MSRNPYLYSIQPLLHGRSLSCAAPWRGARSGRVRRPMPQRIKRSDSDVEHNGFCPGHEHIVAIRRMDGLYRASPGFRLLPVASPWRGKTGVSAKGVL